jgi:hypothetical protein
MQNWEMEKEGVRVKKTYEIWVKDAINQIVAEKIKLKVDDHGRKMTLVHQEDLRLFFPAGI